MSSKGCFRAIGGWLAGCLAATVVIVALPMLGTFPFTGRGPIRLTEGLGLLLGPSALVFVVVCLMTVIPAIFVVALSITLQVRSPVFFAGAGAMIGLLTISLIVHSRVVWTSNVGELFAVAGLAAGMAYWSVAGRHIICPPNAE